MPSLVSRSRISLRSRPAQKWPPLPCNTTALISAGKVSKQWRNACTSGSFNALRLAARLMPTTAMAPLNSMVRSGVVSVWVVMVGSILVKASDADVIAYNL